MRQVVLGTLDPNRRPRTLGCAPVAVPLHRPKGRNPQPAIAQELTRRIGSIVFVTLHSDVVFARERSVIWHS